MRVEQLRAQLAGWFVVATRDRRKRLPGMRQRIVETFAAGELDAREPLQALRAQDRIAVIAAELQRAFDFAARGLVLADVGVDLGERVIELARGVPAALASSVASCALP